MKEDIKAGLELMREKFPENQIGKLPKGSKAQMTCPANEKKNCSICGGWHHPKLVHLDFVGHAALTDRLLNCDINWTWEPLAFDEKGLPAFDIDGGLWIKLTVCGMTRIGYGNAEKSQYKEIGSRQKEVIGDALRNASMRFGAALELWHKGDLHVDEEPPEPKKSYTDYIVTIDKLDTVDKINDWLAKNWPEIQANLSKGDVDKFKGYATQIRDVIKGGTNNAE